VLISVFSTVQSHWILNKASSRTRNSLN